MAINNSGKIISEEDVRDIVSLEKVRAELNKVKPFGKSAYTQSTIKMKTYEVGDTDPIVKVSLGGPYHYSVRMKSGFVRIAFQSFSSRPKFNASFEFDLAVDVKASVDGEIIDTFPLRLTDGVMSYKQMR